MPETENAAIIQNADTAYEPRDVDPWALFVVGIGILIFAFIVNLGVWFTYNYLSAVDKHNGLQPSTVVRLDSMTKPPEPRLQIDPADDLKAMRAIEASELHSYAWVNRQEGTVRIPIEQAMKLLVEEGLSSPTQSRAGKQR